jgi:hypothetical protein
MMISQQTSTLELNEKSFLFADLFFFSLSCYKVEKHLIK